MRVVSSAHDIIRQTVSVRQPATQRTASVLLAVQKHIYFGGLVITE